MNKNSEQYNFDFIKSHKDINNLGIVGKVTVNIKSLDKDMLSV